jgi:hypothetical protein
VTRLGERMDLVDTRVAHVAAEVSRAKTLWPVALRSLEARLDDVMQREDERPAAPVSPEGATEHDDADEVLAGLRDSLQAMENVAAEFERASDGATPDESDDTPPAQEAVAGGARIVLFRADP